MLKTTLYDQHLALGAKMVDFAGWQMPLHYGSQLQEHQTVRNDAGIFDVSHMLVIDIAGSDATTFLRNVLANDVQKLNRSSKALYSCLLNPEGGIKDDLIVYRLGEQRYRCVVNAGPSEKDLAWLKSCADQKKVTISARRDLAILAIQGPQAIPKMQKIFSPFHYEMIMQLKPFQAVDIDRWLVARTGYTGEDGIEVMLPQEDVVLLWQQLLQLSIKAIGLGARDTLRLEAGFNLYGEDMDESVTPLESNLEWTVDWRDETRDFIGKSALINQRQSGVQQKLVGIVLLEKGICRANMEVLGTDPVGNIIVIGKVTSGSFSPTLSCGIGLARIQIGEYSLLQLEIRGKKYSIKMVKPPFVKKGAAHFSL
ncbi:MAG: glycine cleavage system aminomethyltransferase GcvT [Candidatus Berkiellales bacterium]